MDIQLHYTEQGSGEPLILLHGNGDSSTYFAGQIPAFARYYRVIAVDTRGHGQSPRGRAPFTIRQFAEDLHDFMDGQGIEKAHILGFSDGGNIALVFALRYPERVGKLILNGANLDGKGVRPQFQIPITLGYHAAALLGKRSPAARQKAELLGLMVNDPALTPEDLRQLTVPTLVVCGTEDMIKDRHSRLICVSLPNARWARLPGSHFVAAEHPEAFNQTVLNFLAPAAE